MMYNFLNESLPLKLCIWRYTNITITIIIIIQKHSTQTTAIMNNQWSSLYPSFVLKLHKSSCDKNKILHCHTLKQKESLAHHGLVEPSLAVCSAAADVNCDGD